MGSRLVLVDIDVVTARFCAVAGCFGTDVLAPLALAPPEGTSVSQFAAKVVYACPSVLTLVVIPADQIAEVPAVLELASQAPASVADDVLATPRPDAACIHTGAG